ncbi:MAG: hypothetical protein WA708_21145 [Acidobacteriaceae bacterium]
MTETEEVEPEFVVTGVTGVVTGSVTGVGTGPVLTCSPEPKGPPPLQPEERIQKTQTINAAHAGGSVGRM